MEDGEYLRPDLGTGPAWQPENAARPRLTNSFQDIQRRIEDVHTPQDEREQLVEQRARMADEANRAGLFDDARVSLSQGLPDVDYDDVTTFCVGRGDNLERSAEQEYYKDHPEWRGMVRTLVQGTANMITYNGLMNRGPDRGNDWLARKGYPNPEQRQRLRKNAYNRYYLDILGSNPEEFVRHGPRQPDFQQPPQVRRSHEDEGPYQRTFVQYRRDFVINDEFDANVQDLTSGAVDTARNVTGGLEGRIKEFWQGRVANFMSRARKQAAATFEQLLPIQEDISAGKRETELLLRKEEVLETTSLYAHVIKNDLNPQEILLGGMPDIRQIAMDLMGNLMGSGMSQDRMHIYIGEMVRDIQHCPQSVFEIKDESQYRGLRMAMKYWLITNRGLSPRYREGDEWESDSAADAEQISWNFIYRSNIIEDLDSRFDIGARHAKRLPPIDGLKSLAMWMVMHPQERLEAKTTGELPENWSAFGEWSKWKQTTIRGKLTRWSPVNQDILPKRLIKNMFEEVKDAEGRYFMEIFDSNGRVLAQNAQSLRQDLYFPNFGSSGGSVMREAPFATYQLQVVNPATLVFKVITSGGLKDKSLKDVANALNLLGVNDNRYREHILMAWNGIKRKSYKLAPIGGFTDYNTFKQQLKDYVNFFA